MTKQTIFLFALLFVAVSSCLPANAQSSASGSWSGTIVCSYGSGSLAIQIDADGKVTGGVTNGNIVNGKANGGSITFTTNNWLGNASNFTGRISGDTLSGTYTQSTTSETCRFQASRTGARILAAKPNSAQDNSTNEECPVTFRSKGKGSYFATNPCQSTSVHVVVDTMDFEKKCERSVETVFRGESTHLIYSYFSTAPKKVFQCNTMSGKKKNPGCTYKALVAKFGKTC